METVDNEVLQALSARKSVRVYTDEPVTEAERDAILQAAFQAPTAGNQQLYTILNITDPALKARLADLCDHQPFIAKAPLVLVFLADCRRWLQAYKAAGIEDVRTPGVGDLLLAMADTCIAAQNAVVAAESLGIGSCYIGDVIENAEQMREALHLPEHVLPACMLVFGRPTDQQKARRKQGVQAGPWKRHGYGLRGNAALPRCRALAASGIPPWAGFCSGRDGGTLRGCLGVTCGWAGRTGLRLCERLSLLTLGPLYHPLMPVTIRRGGRRFIRVLS